MMQNIKANHYMSVWEQRVRACKGSIAYCKDMLSYDLEAWERKEYEGVLVDHENELPGLLAQLEKVKTNNW